MKKQTKQLIALIAVLVVVIAVYFGLRAWNGAQDEKESAEEQPQTLTDLIDLTQLSYTTQTGERLTFHKEGEVWVSSDAPELPLLQELISEMETLFCGLPCERAMEEYDALEDYGLKPAVCTVTGIDGSDNSYTILLGNEVDYSGIYYAMVEGRDVVYTITGDLVEAISYDLMELAELESIPELTEKTVKSLSLTADGNALTLNKLTEKKQEIQQEDSGEVDENGEAVMENVVVTTEIYHWSLSDGTQIPGGNETLNGVLEELSQLSFSSVYGFAMAQEELEVLGLTDAATVLNVECMDGSGLTLIIGNPDESAENCFVCLDPSGRVYLMPVSNVDTLLAMTAEALAAEPAAGEVQ